MRARHLTAGAVGFLTLTLEIAYTRIISFKLFYYYTYPVIGLALLGIGVAATATAVSPRLRQISPTKAIRLLAPAVAVIGTISFAVIARLPTDVDKIWVGSGAQSVAQIGLLIVLALALAAIFSILGLVFALLLATHASDVRLLYFWDLLGAAMGCLVAVPLQRVIGPPTMILAGVVLFGLTGIAAAASEKRGLRVSVVGMALIAAFAVFVGSYDVRTDNSKPLETDGAVTDGGWGAVFRVDTVDFGDLQLLHHDGLIGSAIWRYDGTPATTDRFATDSRQIPWAALGKVPERILIIGAAGGNEIQAALTYGVGHIDAVELNPITHDLLSDDFADYSGNITNLDNVNYVTGDGRTFLARSDDAYDLVWFVAPDSYSASNAATSGAFVLSESYLYTQEMIEESFEHLADDGLIVAQFGDFDFTTRPTRTARYLVTSRHATQDMAVDFADRTVLVVEDNDAEFARVSTIILSNSPFDTDDVDRIQTSIDEVPTARAVYLSGGAGSLEGITAEIIQGDDAQVDALVGSYRYDISVVTDDRPFFWHFSSFTDVTRNFGRGIEDLEIAIGERLLLVQLLIGVTVAAALLWLPFALSGRSRRAEPTVRGRARLGIYFGAIGLGFMMIEISMIQRFALLLGYPTLSLSVSLFTLLISTAIGARFSESVIGGRNSRLGFVVAATAITMLTYIQLSDQITERALAWPSPLRIALVICLLFPVGCMLGMFLPTGIDQARSRAFESSADEGRLVAWCWAVNGFASVVGATLTTIVSMVIGFDRTVIVGLGFYAIAASALAATRSRIDPARLPATARSATSRS